MTDLFIALYRGINVLGNSSVKMVALRAMHERMGYENVASYIQSGNVVFSAKGEADAIAARVASEFAREFGFAAKVIVMDDTRLGAIVKANPYAKFAAANPRTVHAGICQGEPSARSLKELFKRIGASESFAVKRGIVYLHAPDGFGTSKFASGMEKACGVPMTVRNWRTMEALWKMVNERSKKETGTESKKIKGTRPFI